MSNKIDSSSVPEFHQADVSNNSTSEFLETAEKKGALGNTPVIQTPAKADKKTLSEILDRSSSQKEMISAKKILGDRLKSLKGELQTAVKNSAHEMRLTSAIKAYSSTLSALELPKKNEEGIDPLLNTLKSLRTEKETALEGSPRHKLLESTIDAYEAALTALHRKNYIKAKQYQECVCFYYQQALKMEKEGALKKMHEYQLLASDFEKAIPLYEKIEIASRGDSLSITHLAEELEKEISKNGGFKNELAEKNGAALMLVAAAEREKLASNPGTAHLLAERSSYADKAFFCLSASIDEEIKTGLHENLPCYHYERGIVFLKLLEESSLPNFQARREQLTEAAECYDRAITSFSHNEKNASGLFLRAARAYFNAAQHRENQSAFALNLRNADQSKEEAIAALIKA